EFLPCRVAVPDELLLVGQENVGLAIAIDIRGGDAVADLDLVVDGLGAKFRFGRGVRDRCECERQDAKAPRIQNQILALLSLASWRLGVRISHCFAPRRWDNSHSHIAGSSYAFFHESCPTPG